MHDEDDGMLVVFDTETGRSDLGSEIARISHQVRHATSGYLVTKMRLSTAKPPNS